MVMMTSSNIKGTIVRYIAKGIINPSGPKSCKKMDIDLIANKCPDCGSLFEKRVDFGKCRCTNRDIKEPANITLVHIISYFNPTEGYDWNIDNDYLDSVIVVRDKPNKFSDIYFVFPNSTKFRHEKFTEDDAAAGKDFGYKDSEDVIFVQKTKNSSYYILIEGAVLKLVDSMFKIKQINKSCCKQ